MKLKTVNYFCKKLQSRCCMVSEYIQFVSICVNLSVNLSVLALITHYVALSFDDLVFVLFYPVLTQKPFQMLKVN